MSVGIFLYERLALGTGTFVMNLTRHARDWQHVTRAVGGYWQADFTITPDTMTRHEMENFYNTCMGRRVVESSYGITSWEGEIVQMGLTLNGVTHRRTMDPERWHNKVMARYTDNLTHASGATAWAETTESSDAYGESCYIDTLGDNYDVTGAEGVRDRRLAENAYPKSIPSGGLARQAGGSGASDSLAVLCEGYVFSMNRRFQEADIAADAVSTQISTLVGNSEFVTAGLVTTNAFSIAVTGTSIAQRLWDIIGELVLVGDGTDRWVGGVYEDRLFYYNAAQTAVTHYWRQGRLLDLSGAAVPPSLIRPDIIVQTDTFTLGLQPPSASVTDNPRNAYIEEVEFIYPDSYRLVPYTGGYSLAGQA
jgi:hypothetical protein